MIAILCEALSDRCEGFVRTATCDRCSRFTIGRCHGHGGLRSARMMVAEHRRSCRGPAAEAVPEVPETAPLVAPQEPADRPADLTTPAAFDIAADNLEWFMEAHPYPGQLEMDDDDIPGIDPAEAATEPIDMHTRRRVIVARARPQPYHRKLLPKVVRSGAVMMKEKSSQRKLSPIKNEPYTHPRTGKHMTRFTPVAPFIASTYVSIDKTCSSECPFKDDGCYIDSGFTRIFSMRMNTAAAGMTADQVIAEEAAAIRGAFRGKRVPRDGGRTGRAGRDLRLHVGGDVGTTRGAELLAEAARDWRRRGGGTVFSYTHWWREISFEAWGPIAILASVEKVEDIAVARAFGYAAALVVDRFPSPKAFMLGGEKVVPCPAQTGDTTCVECRLCIDRDLLGMKVTIGFEAHGQGVAQARRHLPVLRSA